MLAGPVNSPFPFPASSDSWSPIESKVPFPSEHPATKSSTTRLTLEWTTTHHWDLLAINVWIWVCCHCRIWDDMGIDHAQRNPLWVSNEVSGRVECFCTIRKLKHGESCRRPRGSRDYNPIVALRQRKQLQSTQRFLWSNRVGNHGSSAFRLNARTLTSSKSRSPRAECMHSASR